MPNPIACRSCGAMIVMLKTAKGHLIPVNAETVRHGDEDYEADRHISHFATCPEAKRWRKKRM